MNDNLINNTQSITEALIRIKVIEKILINSNLTTQEELNQELKNISNIILKEILIKANVQGDLDQIIESLQKN